MLSVALISAVILAVLSYSFGVDLESQTYKALKSSFFVPLKKWIYPVIGAAMFSVFFRSPEGKAGRFFILLADIMVLYLLSTFIANIFAFSVFDFFPFVETITPLLTDSEVTNFNKTAPGGIPTVIWVMIIGLMFDKIHVKNKIF